MLRTDSRGGNSSRLVRWMTLVLALAVAAGVFAAPGQAAADGATASGGPDRAAASIKATSDAPSSQYRAQAASTSAGPEPPVTYWLVAADGGIFAFGEAPFYGSTGALKLNRPIVGMAATPSGHGYWLVASDGGIFAYGDAAFYGSTGSIHLNKPIVGMATTPTGGGYWLVASDGGIFAFGDAGFHGSTGALRLNAPVVGMAARPDGAGYWLAASDGGIFAFDAPFAGSAGGTKLNKPVVTIAASTTGGGYWLAASDGGIFAYGDAAFYGSTGAIHLNQPIVSMAATPTRAGYWLVASDGGIFAFGDAGFRGSLAGRHLNQPIVGMAYTYSVDPYRPGATGYDISWPQCGGAYPPAPNGVAIVGVNNGRSFSTNPCLASEATWAAPSGVSLYINVNSPSANDLSLGRGSTGPAGTCSSGDTNCQSYNFGWNAATMSYNTAQAAGVSSGIWWLDVETGGSSSLWSSDVSANSRVIQGGLDGLTAQGVLGGVYSTPYQWGVITGGYTFPSFVPLWQAGAYDPSTGALRTSYCTKTFGGGRTYLIQGAAAPFDTDYAC